MDQVVDSGFMPGCDLHLHSRWSDGLLSVGEIVEYADRLDLEVVAITDHYPAMHTLHSPESNVPLREYLADIESQRKRALDCGVRLLTGIELDVAGNITDLPLDRLDLLLVEGLAGNLSNFFPQFRAIVQEVRRAQGPTFPVILAHPDFGKLLPDEIGPQIDLLERWGIILELNTAYKNYLHNTDLYEYLAQATDLRFSLGSDAHSGDRVGQIFPAWQFLQQYQIPSRFFLARDFGIV